MAQNRLYLERRFRFQHLQMLCDIAASGTLTLAAERQHVSRAAVSKALAELEQGLGVVLFERSAQGMRPTATGHQVIQEARRLLESFQHLLALAEPVPSQRPLRLGISPFFSSFVPSEIAPRQAPSADAPPALVVREGWLVPLARQLLAEELDVILSFFQPSALSPMERSQLGIESLGVLPLSALAPPSLAPSSEAVLNCTDLSELPWVLPSSETRLRHVLDEAFSRHGFSPPSPVMEAFTLSGNIQLASTGLGLTAAPLYAVKHELRSGALRVLNTRHPFPSLTVALLSRKGADIATPSFEGMRTIAKRWVAKLDL